MLESCDTNLKILENTHDNFIVQIYFVWLLIEGFPFLNS